MKSGLLRGWELSGLGPYCLVEVGDSIPGRAEAIRELMAALGESPAEFDQVRDGLYRAPRPRDAFEELLVDNMAELHWRLRRMIRGEVADPARGRREQMRRLDELEARFESGKFHDVERTTIPTLGFAWPVALVPFYRSEQS